MVDEQPVNITSGTPSDTSIVHASEDGLENNSRGHNERDISRLQSSGKAYDETKTYKIDDIATLLDELVQVRCTTVVTASEPYDPLKWAAVDPQLETGLITGVPNQNFTIKDIVAIAPNQALMETNEDSFFQAGDVITINATNNYDAKLPTPAQVLVVQGGNEYVVGIAGLVGNEIGELSGDIRNLTRFNVSEINLIIVDGTIPFNHRVYPIHRDAVNGFQPVFIDGSEVWLIDKDNNDNFIPGALIKPSDRIEQAAIAILQTTDTPVDFILLIEPSGDPIVSRTISNRLINRFAQGQMFRGGLLQLGSSGTEIKITAGQFYHPATNLSNSFFVSDFTVFDEINPVKSPNLIRAWDTGPSSSDTSGDAPSDNVEFANYSPVGSTTPQPVPSGKFTWVRIFSDPKKTIYKLGKTAYDSLEAGLERQNNEIEFNRKDLTIESAYRGRILARNDVTDFSTAVEDVDYILQAVPEGYSYDDGNPQGNTEGLTHEQLQTAIGGESTGVFFGGLMDIGNRNISSITDDGGGTYTITTETDHGYEIGEDVVIWSDNNVLNGTTTVVTTPTTTTFTVSIGAGGDGTASSGACWYDHLFSYEIGEGQIVDTSVFGSYDVNFIEWPAGEKIDLSIDNKTDNSTIYILINSSGAVEYVTTSSSTLDASTLKTKIQLGIIRTKFNSDAVGPFPIRNFNDTRTIVNSPVNQLRQFIGEVFTNQSGIIISELNPITTLQSENNGGSIVKSGLNSDTDMNIPNTKTVSSQSPTSYIYVSQRGEEDGDFFTVPDSANYDNGVTISAVGPSEYTASRKWFDPLNLRHYWQYGAAVYASVDVAGGGTPWVGEDVSTPPNLSQVAFVIATYIIRGNSIAWNDDPENRIIQGDATAAGGGAGTSGGGQVNWSEVVIDTNKDMLGTNLTNLGIADFQNSFVTSPINPTLEADSSSALPQFIATAETFTIKDDDGPALRFNRTNGIADLKDFRIEFPSDQIVFRSYTDTGIADTTFLNFDLNDKDATLLVPLNFLNLLGQDPVLSSNNVNPRLTLSGEFEIENAAIGGDNPVIQATQSTTLKEFDVDGASMVNFSTFQFVENLEPVPSATTRAIWYDADGYNVNYLTDDSLKLLENGVKLYEFDSTGFEIVNTDGGNNPRIQVIPDATRSKLLINSQDFVVNNLISNVGIPADAEFLRLANTENIAWRNQANDDNLLLSVNASDQLEFNGPILANAFEANNTGGTNPTLVANTSTFQEFTANASLFVISSNVLTALSLTVPNGPVDQKDFRIASDGANVSFDAFTDAGSIDQEFMDFDIENKHTILSVPLLLAISSSIIADSDTAIYRNGAGMVFNLPATKDYQFQRDGDEILLMSVSGADFMEQDVFGVADLSAKNVLIDDTISGQGFLQINDIGGDVQPSAPAGGMRLYVRTNSNGDSILFRRDTQEILKFNNPQIAQATASTIVFNMSTSSKETSENVTLNLTGDTKFEVSGANPTDRIEATVHAGIAPRNLTWENGWKFVTGTAPPTIDANQTMLIRLYAYGTNESTDIRAEVYITS